MIDHITIIIVIQCLFCALQASVRDTITILLYVFVIVHIQNGFRWFAVVRFDVERWEHVSEEASVECQQKSNWFWEITCGLELNLGCMHEDDKELNLE